MFINVFTSSSISAKRIDSEMASVFASRAVYRGFEPQSDQTNDYKIGICGISAKHVAFRNKSKDWLARNQKRLKIPKG